MSDEFMYSWRVKWILAATMLVLFFAFDRWVARYATVVQEGSLQRAVVIGKVVDIDSGDILYLRDGSTRIGRILESDMYGNIEFLDKSGELLKLKKGNRPQDVRRVVEEQDQILTMKILTWPKELREKGSDFRGTTVVVGNRFQGRFLDRVLRIGDRLFMDIPLKRASQIERVALREYFRAPFLLRLTALLCVVVIIVAGVKGLMTLVATLVSVTILLVVFVPGALGRTGQAALNGGWIFGGLVLFAGVAWFVRHLFDPEGGARFRENLRNRWVFVPAWIVGGLVSGALVWALLRLIGPRPVALALFIALAVTFITFSIITGFSPKVISGSLGTVGGLIACAIISIIASKLLWLTGLAVGLGFLDLGSVLWRDPEASQWPFVDFLTAGLIIAALGAMMDVSMSVSSTIYEVKRANPNVSVAGAMKAGYNVGKDIMSTMTDTLIFAFIGADLLLIVMPGLDYGGAGNLFAFVRMVNGEETTVEAIHALMGTLGLVLAIPISAFIAALLTARMRPKQVYAAEPEGNLDA